MTTVAKDSTLTGKGDLRLRTPPGGSANVDLPEVTSTGKETDKRLDAHET